MTHNRLFILILASLVLGSIVGLLFGNTLIGTYTLSDYLTPLGTLFIRLLRMIVVPVVLFSLISGVSSMKLSHLGIIGTKTIILYMLTGVMAALIGLTFANLFPFQENVLSLSENTAQAPVFQNVPFLDMLIGMVPTNPFEALNSGNMLQIIVFAIFFGIGLSALRSHTSLETKKSAELIFSFCHGMAEIMYILVRWIMLSAPIGVFALMVTVFAKNGWEVIAPLTGFIGVVFFAFFAQIALIYTPLLWYSRFSLKDFLQKTRAPLATALVTRSSSATLPVSLAAAEENLGVPRKIASFTLPLGATINMDGTTIQQCISVFFIAGMSGMSLDFSQQLTILLVTLFTSIGTAGIPSGSVVMLLVVLETIGLAPTNGSVIAVAYGMLLGIDALMDMGRTTVNVMGDLVCTTVISKASEKETK